MDLSCETDDLLTAYLAPFLELARDRRTATRLAATVRGLVASESLICARLAAFSPSPGRRAP